MVSANAISREKARPIRTDLLVVGGVLLAILTFGPALSELIQRWNQQAEYSYGYLIPVVTLYLLWTRRDALRETRGRPSWLGVVVTLLAGAMNIIGHLSAIYIFSQIGFVIAVMGILLAAGGYALLRVAFIPIAYLLFAIPLPAIIDAALTLRLQLISSQLGVFFINLFGIPVYLDGNIIDLGNYKIQVVEACSGLRYVFPLLSLSFLAAYLFHAPIWQRVLVFLSAIPIAIGMNGFRLGLLGVLIDRWGPQMAEGALHFFEGWAVFLGCAILLAAEIYALSLIYGRTFAEVFYLPEIAAKRSSHSSGKLVGRWALSVSLLLLCIGGMTAISVSGRQEQVRDRTRFVEFPSRVGDWQGHPSLLDLGTEKVLGLDDYILSDYRQSNGAIVNLYVAYYASQRNGEAPHSPSDCIPGGGWKIINQQEIHYPTKLGDEQPINRAVIEKGGIKQLVYYWFDEHGKTVANEYWAKFYRLKNSILKNNTDAALVRLVTPIKSDESRIRR